MQSVLRRDETMTFGYTTIQFSELPKDNYDKFKQYIASITRDILDEYMQTNNIKFRQNPIVILSFNFSDDILHINIKPPRYHFLIDKYYVDYIAFVCCIDNNTLYIPPKIPDKERYEQFVKMLYEIAIVYNSKLNKPNIIGLLLNTQRDHKHKCIINSYYTDSLQYNVIKLARWLLYNKELLNEFTE